MDCGGRLNRHFADAHLVADIDLADVREASDEPAAPGRHDDCHVGSEQPQRWQVEMVEVDVRDEGGVDRSELAFVERDAPPEMPHPGAKDGVSQQAYAVQLDQNGRVPDVEDPAGDGFLWCHRASVFRCLHFGVPTFSPRWSSDFIPSV